MFVRRISIVRVDGAGGRHACPIKWIDNFAMRNFTNHPVFDDTLPVADGTTGDSMWTTTMRAN